MHYEQHPFLHRPVVALNLAVGLRVVGTGWDHLLSSLRMCIRRCKSESGKKAREGGVLAGVEIVRCPPGTPGGENVDHAVGAEIQ